MAVSEGQVTLQDGTTLSANYIVLCHGGAPSPFPCGPMDGQTSSASVLGAMRDAQRQIAQAKSILIVGGGPVGCELAGEIKSAHPTKKIILAHSQPALLSNSSPPVFPAATERVRAVLVEVGVDVRLGVRVLNLPAAVPGNSCFITGENTFTLHSEKGDESVTADLTYVAIGGAFQRGAKNIVSVVDEANLVKVNACLQVEGMKTVFCCGDANNHRETKLAYTGSQQAQHTVKNICNMEKGKVAVPYVGMTDKGDEYGAMFVPIGPQRGVGALGTSVMGDFAIKMIKGKGLFSSAQFKQSGIPLPDI